MRGMSSFGPRPGAADRAPSAGAEFYDRAAWMAVMAEGEISQAVVESAVRQCELRGVPIEVFMIDELPFTDLHVFSGMVAAPPSDEPLSRSEEKSLLQVAAAMTEYRRIRPMRARELLQDKRPSYRPGVLQVVARSTVLDIDGMRQVVRRDVDLAHPLGPKSTPEGVDFFSVFDLSTLLQGDESQVEFNRRRTWAYLEQWNITTPEMVLGAHRAFEKWIKRLSDPSYTALSRPVSGIPGNRLQRMLRRPDEPEPNGAAKNTAAHKNWTEDGARCGRYVLEELKQVDSRIQRPGKGRGQQKDLATLYAMLTVLIQSAEFRETVSGRDSASAPD